MTDHSALDRMIARLRALPKALTRDVARDVAEALRTELVDQISRGEGPDGKPWQATQEGKVALRGAARALTVRAVGSHIVARLTGIEARHNYGAVRGGVKRQILPSDELPAPFARAIDKVIKRAFRDATAGGR